MMKKVLIIVCVLQSIFTSAQVASLRGSGSFLSNEDYESCIVSCSEDYDTESSGFGQCRSECNDTYSDDITPCQSRCWRLRLTRSGQVDCIVDCSADEEPTKEPLEDSSSGDEDNTDRTADGEDNYESCIVSCSEEYDTESSDFGQCRTECNEAYADDITPCQSRCWRLRLTRDGQVDCIVDCSADDTDADASVPPEDVSMDATPPPYEGDATPPPYEDPGTQPPVPVDNPCKRRCDMLKIAPGPSMNACLDKCPTDDFYVRVS